MKKVPVLRFPGFEEAWEEKFIGDLYKNLSTGMTPYRGIPEYYHGDILWITSGELNYNHIYDTKEKITLTAVRDTNLKIYEPGTFFIAITGLEAPGTRGKCAINARPATTNQSCMAFEELPCLKSIFLFYWYNKYGVKLYYGYAQGTKQQSFNNKIVEGFKIHLPTLPEQQKIAAFLASVDTRIQQLTRKKALLEQYKKGVMQQLFSQEIRFKDADGKAFPEWETTDIAGIVTGGKGSMKIGPFGSQLRKDTFTESGFKVYGQENIFINDFEFGERYIAKEHFERLKSNELHQGDFVISTMGTIGKCAIVPSNIQRGIMDSHIIRLQLDKLKADPGYLAQLFLSHFILKQIKSLSVGGIMDGLSMGIINELIIPLPSLPEQQKIAAFLTALDDKINRVGGQIGRMQTWKKGLLQRMFV